MKSLSLNLWLTGSREPFIPTKKLLKITHLFTAAEKMLQSESQQKTMYPYDNVITQASSLPGLDGIGISSPVASLIGGSPHSQKKSKRRNTLFSIVCICVFPSKHFRHPYPRSHNEKQGYACCPNLCLFEFKSVDFLDTPRNLSGP